MILKLLSILPPVARLLKRYRRALVEINDEFSYGSRAELEAYLDDDSNWNKRPVPLDWNTWEESQGIKPRNHPPFTVEVEQGRNFHTF